MTNIHARNEWDKPYTEDELRILYFVFREISYLIDLTKDVYSLKFGDEKGKEQLNFEKVKSLYRKRKQPEE